MGCSCVRALFLLFVIFVFGKIYQHNQVVRLSYHVQRLDRFIHGLKAEKNKMLVLRLQAVDYKIIECWAKDDAKMSEISLKNVRQIVEG